MIFYEYFDFFRVLQGQGGAGSGFRSGQSALLELRVISGKDKVFIDIIHLFYFFLNWFCCSRYIIKLEC